MAEPIAVMVRRYRCPHCGSSRSKRSATAAHIGRCWLNPNNRTCKTCVHLDLGGDACGCEPGCNWGGSPIPPSCDAGRVLPDGAAFPATNCPLWEASGGTQEAQEDSP